MREMGLRVSVFFPCLFFINLPGDSQVLIGVATDNLEFCSTRDDRARAMVKTIKDALEAKWPMTFETEADDILGIFRQRIPNGPTIFTQPNVLASVRRFVETVGGNAFVTARSGGPY
jgi:hypothetical protein